LTDGYSIDTSSLIEAWHRQYPIDIFSGLWERLDDMIDSGLLRAADEVRIELEKKDDELLAWARDRPQLFRELDEDVQVYTAEVLSLHPLLVQNGRGRHAADPWVIGLARAEDLVVVTNEVRTHNSLRPRIPDVCYQLGVRCISVLGLIRDQDWSFH
jgi:hypothetical protein